MERRGPLSTVLLSQQKTCYQVGSQPIFFPSLHSAAIRRVHAHVYRHLFAIPSPRHCGPELSVRIFVLSNCIS